MFQYPQSKICPREQNFSMLPAQNNKMVSFLSHTQSFFCFIEKCFQGSRDHKLWSSPRIYIRAIDVFMNWLPTKERVKKCVATKILNIRR